MKKIILMSLTFLISTFLYGQSEIDTQVEQINREGMKLYYLEKTSWVASDILYNKFHMLMKELLSVFL
jgi:hypothetical protein